MADFEELQQKEIRLDLDGIPSDKQKEAKEAVGLFLVDAIASKVADGQSPVSGERAFKKLSKKYADKEKGGNTNPNLELEGDMLGALGFKTTGDGVAVGIMEASQREKADGHNQLSGRDTPLPRRRFIPASNQSFKSDIMEGVDAILAEFRQEDNREGISTEIDLGKILSNESIEQAILRRLRGV